MKLERMVPAESWGPNDRHFIKVIEICGPRRGGSWICFH